MPDTSVAVTSPLRIALVALLAPSFPLCLVHGILTHSPVPAVGLVPQFVSAATAGVIIYYARQRRRNPNASGDAELAVGLPAAIGHPVVVFIVDTLLAAAFMVVLVITWIRDARSNKWDWRSRRHDMSMLAAYATLPLLMSFFIHAFLALQALYHGLAVHGLVQWAAWRAVPPDCPNCNTRLRSALPEFPWIRIIRDRVSRSGYTRVSTVDEEDQYHDEDAQVRPDQPDPVEVRAKRKAKGTSPITEVEPWES